MEKNVGLKKDIKKTHRVTQILDSEFRIRASFLMIIYET